MRPAFPQLFSSGCIINGFTPDDRDKRQTDTLINAIQQFDVGVVLVIDNDKLERDITKRI